MSEYILLFGDSKSKKAHFAVLDLGEKGLELVGLGVQASANGAVVVLGLGHVVLACVDGLVDADRVLLVRVVALVVLAEEAILAVLLVVARYEQEEREERALELRLASAAVAVVERVVDQIGDRLEHLGLERHSFMLY